MRRLAVAQLGALALMWLGEPASARQKSAPPQPSSIPWISWAVAQDLSAAVERYRQIEAAGGWPEFPGRVILRPGDSDDLVRVLRRRLQISGDLPAGQTGSYEFDRNLEAAVKRYQMRHGLERTGVVYGITQRSLNVSARDRLAQLDRNLRRVRDAIQHIGNARKYIVMNAASFELQGIRDGHVEVISRTIAGKRSTPTPVVSASVRAINLLPYWHVPSTIAKAALIPKLRKDPGYLYRERIRVFSAFGGEEIDPATVNWWGPEATRFVFRQDPGPQNALGLLRFDMPNKHIVYMHDTPMKQLFGYFERAYSAGCVRVQNFYSLAEWVLDGNDGWDARRLQETAQSGKAETIRVKTPVPVHFVYLTAWVESGEIQFRNDLYNLDEGPVVSASDPTGRVLNSALAP